MYAINIFTVAPESQFELVELLKEATEKVMCNLAGYISANLHISDDKKPSLIMPNGFLLQTLMASGSEDAQMHMKKAASLALEIKPVTYNEISSHSK